MNWNPFRRRTERRAITGLPWSTGLTLEDVTYRAPVTFDRAASFGAVFGAWRYLGDQIATLPLHAYRDLGDRRQRLGSLPQLFQQPASQGTLVDWLYRAVAAMASRGNAVGLVTLRDGFGFPTGVEWTNPDEWRVVDQPPQASVAQPVWYWQGRRVPSEDVVHIPWFPVPGRVWGLSPMGAYAATVAAALGAQEFSRDWFAGGGVPPGTFKNETQELVSKQESDAVKARLVAAIRTHQPIVYGKDWTFTPIEIHPHEAKFVESQKLGATQIAAIYGVPPEKVGGEAGGSLTYNCADGETEILTTRGWLRYDALSTADTCLTLNVDTGMAEWQPVEAVHVFDGPVDVVKLENQTHSSVTTLNHRWPVMISGRWTIMRDGRRWTRSSGWRWYTTETLPNDARICAAAPAVTPTEPKWSDALVELVAWLWTEGWVGEYGSVTITQSEVANPGNVARIRAALAATFGAAGALQVRERPSWREDHDGRGIVHFRLNAKAGRVLSAHAPGKVVETEFLASLTRAQLELFVQTSVDADGYRRTDGPGVIVAQRDRARLDAFQVACALLGKSGPVRRNSVGMWTMCVTSTPWRKPRGHPEYVTQETADVVWCPSTPNRTWFARRRGTTYFTGNTVELNQLAAQTDAVRPWVTKLEAKFFTMLPERQYVKFNLDAPLRTDLKTRMEIAEIARRIGYRSIDELRELDDLEPLPAGQGGGVFTPLALLEKGLGAVPQPGVMAPPPPAPGAVAGRPRLVQGGQGG